MNSSFESLSIELLFELFDYLSPFDLFRIFINLNNRLNAIVYSYPLRLDFRSICRSKFDFICRHLQPKQVISLILCDEYIPDRVKLFLNHFPHFKEQFLQLQSITLIEAETITFIDLPASVSSLSIRIYDVDDYYYENYISKILSQQAKVLTHLKIDSKDLYDLIDIHFPALTYLIISGGYYYDGNYIDVSVSLENIDVHSLIQQWQCFLTHLYLVIDNKIQYSTFNLDRFSHCLTHLTLHFYQGIQISFLCLERCLIKLSQLIKFTCQATGSWDLIDGKRWEQLLLKTQIIRFNFKFTFNLILEISSILEPFRSLFWLEQRHWYVGCYQDETEKGTIIYSIPRFQTRTLKYPSAKFPHMTTAPSIIEQNFFYSSRINYFSFDMNKLITPVDYRFHQVKSLTLSGSSLLSLNILSSIVALQQVQYLDVSNINRLLPNELENLIAHTPRIIRLSMKFDPLFIIPSQIRYLLLDGLGRSISLDRLSYTISSVERLEISMASKQMIIDVIDRFNGLENLDIYFDDGDLDDDCMTICKGVSIDWLIKHTHRLKSYDFTCRYSREFYPSIYLSFGDRRKENNNQD
ncbi:unnamed protein product [Rotaria sordida]|uniref:F-box domain-containing protein n=2 Tax=Rotaria sordida TaxID=392033 RepID=A0A814SX84_9BILA|nr:unnamed protein product [Rotaria sordida]CAF1270066.1 unnamed protein product [Rotaria sordida]